MRGAWTGGQGQRRRAHRTRGEVNRGGGGDWRGTGRHHRAGRADRRVCRGHCYRVVQGCFQGRATSAGNRAESNTEVA